MQIYALDLMFVQNGTLGTPSLRSSSLSTFWFLITRSLILQQHFSFVLICNVSYRGFPVWLKYVPGISFRTDNEPFKVIFFFHVHPPLIYMLKAKVKEKGHTCNGHESVLLVLSKFYGKTPLNHSLWCCREQCRDLQKKLWG